MAEALLFAAVASGALVAGGALGAVWTPPGRVLAFLLAFASGALISALAFELFENAHRQAGLALASGALLLGAAAFVGADLALQRATAGREATGFAIVAAVTLDGIPENLALGVSLVGASSYVLLVAIGASNFAESLHGSVDLREGGSSGRRAFLVWAGAALVLGAAVVLGRFALSGAPEQTLGVLLAFAGGAVIASLADTLMPVAYREGGPLVAFGTAAGFLLSYALAGA